MTSFEKLANGFFETHKNPLNVALHLLTTPVCLVTALNLVNTCTESCKVTQFVTLVYVLSLFNTLSFPLWFVTALASTAIGVAACFLQLPWQYAAGLFVAGYFGQDLAHLISGEITFQSTYMEQKNWISQLAEHTYYLLPLTLAATTRMESSFLDWFVPQNTVVNGKLDSDEDQQTLGRIRSWVMSQNPSTEMTTHWWFKCLDTDVKNDFASIADGATVESIFRSKFNSKLYGMKTLEGMNEIYVACEKHNSNSDTVFYMQHIDGPWYIWPFCGAYRCILAVNPNKRVATYFPGLKKHWTLSDGDFVGFDFNREIHYIANNPETNDEPRITLKLHYVVYPRFLAPIGRLLGFVTTMYDITARNLFNATKAPSGLFWQGMAYIVLIVTWMVFAAEQYIGYYNLIYISLAALTEYQFPGYNAFLIATSFYHYPMYLATYAQGKNVNFGVFKRNAIVYKGMSMAHLAYQYLSNFELDAASLGLMAGGFALHFAAVHALGVDRTYFGVELGVCEPKYVKKFPYNVVPHPMIVGTIVALAGMYKQAAFRAAMPFLAPAHIAGYLAVMIQEQVYDVYRPVEKTYTINGKKMAVCSGKIEAKVY